MTEVQQLAVRCDSAAPKVSVVIPAYMGAHFISETINSVFAQTFPDFEVIVVNDGSPDTPQLEAVLQPYMDRIRYVKQANRGPSAARNTGIRHARGEFLAFLDSDDIWLPGYLAAQVRFLSSHPEVDASVADVVRFGEAAEEAPWAMVKNGNPNILAFTEMLARKGGQIPSASVARRLRAIEVGMFDEDLRFAEDLEFLVRISFPDRAVGYLRQSLVKYRQHPGSLTGGAGNRKWRAGEVEALSRLGKKLNLTAEQRRLLENETAAAAAALALADANHHLSQQEFATAAERLQSANSYYRDFRLKIAASALNVLPRLAGPILNWRANRRSKFRQTKKTNLPNQKSEGRQEKSAAEADDEP